MDTVVTYVKEKIVFFNIIRKKGIKSLKKSRFEYKLLNI